MRLKAGRNEQQIKRRNNIPTPNLIFYSCRTILVDLNTPVLKRYFVLVCVLISSACSRENFYNKNSQNPFCAWMFKGQVYTSGMGGVHDSIPTSILFYTNDTIYPFHTLEYITTAMVPDTYLIEPGGATQNSFLYHHSITTDSVETLTADSGSVQITSKANNVLNSHFFVVFGSDTLSGHCDNLKIQ